MVCIIIGSVLIVAAIVLIGGLFGAFVDWTTLNECAQVRLRLRDFRNMSRINPDKWEWGTLYLKYRGESVCCTVGLSFPAYVWSLAYRRRVQHDQKTSRNVELLLLILEDCQRDIDKSRAEADRQIQDGLRQQAAVLQNMKGVKDENLHS